MKLRHHDSTKVMNKLQEQLVHRDLAVMPKGTSSRGD